MIEPGQPNAAVLKLAFWEAMKRCGDDDRIHAMDHPYHDDPLIDGRIPGELWEHMAAAIQELRAAANGWEVVEMTAGDLDAIDPTLSRRIMARHPDKFIASPDQPSTPS